MERPLYRPLIHSGYQKGSERGEDYGSFKKLLRTTTRYPKI